MGKWINLYPVIVYGEDKWADRPLFSIEFSPSWEIWVDKQKKSDC